MCPFHVKTCTKWLQVRLVSAENLRTSLINEIRGRGEKPQTLSVQMRERGEARTGGRKGQMEKRKKEINWSDENGGR